MKGQTADKEDLDVEVKIGHFQDPSCFYVYLVDENLTRYYSLTFCLKDWYVYRGHDHFFGPSPCFLSVCNFIFGNKLFKAYIKEKYMSVKGQILGPRPEHNYKHLKAISKLYLLCKIQFSGQLLIYRLVQCHWLVTNKNPTDILKNLLKQLCKSFISVKTFLLIRIHQMFELCCMVKIEIET